MLFIKDVIDSNEIYCWSFYGHGKKIAEVCCTATVYATDRKNTKVEFPEARIYEETLNCLLYENRTGPDQDLMQATSHRQGSILCYVRIKKRFLLNNFIFLMIVYSSQAPGGELH